METMKYNLHKGEFSGDTVTPVSVYLALRDVFADCKLLESAEYGKSQYSKSIISFNCLESFSITNSVIEKRNQHEIQEIKNFNDLSVELELYLNEIKAKVENPDDLNVACLVGYIGYNAIKYFETIKLISKEDNLQIPDVHFGLYEFNIVFDHFNSTLSIYQYKNENSTNGINDILNLLGTFSNVKHDFLTLTEEKTHDTEAYFLDSVKKVKHHCKVGDVFQAVISRKFSQNYTGEDFNVYRNLRQINPSPYMFYFDHGDFKLFGSSPEKHVSIANNKVSINPIAGTIKRTGIEADDEVRLNKLILDPKENAEHDMLIDLARNDLSVFCKNVVVKRKKEVQQFSHVYHLVSEVEGEIKNEAGIFSIIAKSFPAGTLSGAPKYRAIQLLDELEQHERNFYGGAIGFIDLKSNVNLAIMIRTFCAKNNSLNYMAGAGVTINSDPQHELIEINNKINALRKAIQLSNPVLNKLAV